MSKKKEVILWKGTCNIIRQTKFQVQTFIRSKHHNDKKKRENNDCKESKALSEFLKMQTVIIYGFFRIEKWCKNWKGDKKGTKIFFNYSFSAEYAQ